MTSNNFRKARLEMKLTQRQMCNLLGISSQPYLSDIERGKKNPGKMLTRCLNLLISKKKENDTKP
jgi:transcriptional regulator with XRE-family HTH domain